MLIPAAGLDHTSAYKLMIGSIIPRPIAWVSTLSSGGVANLAPISFFTCVPGGVSLTIQPKSDGSLKDTFINIRDTGEFVVNMVTLPQVFEVHTTAKDFEPDVDEFDITGLTKVESTSVSPPRVAGSPVAMECKVNKIFEAPGGQHVVWGYVINFHIRDDIYVNGRVDFGAIAPVGRLAAEYTLVDNAFVPPLEPSLLAERSARRMVRLDGEDEYFAAVETSSWSSSGSVKD